MLENKIFASLSDSILIVDQDGILIEVSPSTEHLFKYSKGELIGQKIEVLLPARFRKGHKSMFDSYINNPIPRRMGSGRILFGLTKDGNELPIDIALSSFVEKDHRHYVAIIRDISLLADYQNKLEKTNRQLTSKNQELDRFAHVLAHDLKSPVNNLLGLIELIKMEHGERLDSDLAMYCSHIEKTSSRLSELIEGILKYTLAGSDKEETSVFELRSLWSDVLDTHTINESLQVTSTFPDIRLKTNKTQLFQVISNLFGNAIKYHDKEDGFIQITCVPHQNKLEITIKDNGPGIPEKYHAKIFDLYGKGHSENRKDSTGIGLATVKKLVDQNGGELGFDSTPGVGTEFTFTWNCEIIS